MNKTDYLRNKGLIPSEDFGTMYTFESNREGVSEINGHEIWDKRLGGERMSPTPVVPIYYYKLNESPWSVQIEDDKLFSEHSHLFSGIGDCWSGSTFASMNFEVLVEERNKEIIRIKEKYK